MSYSSTRLNNTILLGLTLLLAFPPSSFAQETPPKTISPEDIDAKIANKSKAGVFHGSLVVVDKNGNTHASATGLMNIDGQSTNTLNTKFQLGAVTKLFTQLMILKLVEQGKIDLDATIATYLPEFDAQVAQAITIRQLYRKESGLPKKLEGVKGLRPDANGMIWPDLCTLEVLLPESIGTKKSPSNFGYWVLGGVIEKVTGQTYLDALKTNLFDPAGMTNTGLGSAWRLDPKNSATGHKYKKGKLKKVDWDRFDNRYAAGGLYSTAPDLAKFISSLGSGELLSTESLNLHHQLRATNGTRPTGAPFYISNVSGYATVLTYDLESGCCAIILNNVTPDKDKVKGKDKAKVLKQSSKTLLRMAMKVE